MNVESKRHIISIVAVIIGIAVLSRLVDVVRTYGYDDAVRLVDITHRIVFFSFPIMTLIIGYRKHTQMVAMPYFYLLMLGSAFAATAWGIDLAVLVAMKTGVETSHSLYALWSLLATVWGSVGAAYFGYYVRKSFSP